MVMCLYASIEALKADSAEVPRAGGAIQTFASCMVNEHGAAVRTPQVQALGDDELVLPYPIFHFGCLIICNPRALLYAVLVTHIASCFVHKAFCEVTYGLYKQCQSRLFQVRLQLFHVP